MSAGDNLAAGLEGFFTGVSNVAVPIITKRNELTLLSQLHKQQAEEQAQLGRDTFNYEQPIREASAESLFVWLIFFRALFS